jgi:hypothetical protein
LASTVNAATFTLKHGSVTDNGTVGYTSGLTATFTPNSILAVSTNYTATITIAVTDLAGNHLASPYVWSFVTGTNPDTTAPIVNSTVPANASTNVSISSAISATFSEALLASTVNAATFTLKHGSVTDNGTVDYTSGLTATFTPNSVLAYSTNYTANITIGVTDLAGNHLASPYVWSFTTGALAGQAQITLGTASTFGVLTNTSVVNAGNIIGDLGIYTPGAPHGDTSLLTGSGTVTAPGTVQIGTVAAGNALDALTSAFTEAQNRSGGAIAVAGNLVTQGNGANLSTFLPGLYVSQTSILLDVDGTITLDAQGDANAVFIFKAGSALTVNANTHILLAHNAQAGNVWWLAPAGATIGGTTSAFVGTVLANAGVTVRTGTLVSGRMLTKNAAVTVQSGVTITAP